MRLFLALDIDAQIRDRILRFVDGVRNFVPEARWMPAESLHVTLKFIGEQPEAVAESIQQSLKTISAPPVELHFHGVRILSHRELCPSLLGGYRRRT